jgi:predicted PurR-regulated permease PerM
MAAGQAQGSKALRIEQGKLEESVEAGEAPQIAGDGDEVTLRRDRLLAALTLIAAVGLLLAMPFALRAASPVFLPLTAAIVIAIALVPPLEWMERHRVPAPMAAFLCVVGFLILVNIALASIVVPAIEWFRVLPERIERIQSNLAPLLDLYTSLDRFLNEILAQFAAGSNVREAQTVATEPPGSIVEVLATSAPTALIEMFFAVLVIYFFLAGWTRLRREAITSRTSFGGAMATARVIQEVVDDTSSYLGTITFINLGLGALIAWALWMMGMPSPLMWGGIVALLNFVPYLGPILAAFLLALGGLMTFADIWMAMAPAALMIAAHTIEANAITPLIIGRRLTINPILILISLSFWGWIWGAPGALLAVPLLIIIQTVARAAGKPDIAGFLFEHGTLTAHQEPPRRGR